MTVIEKFPFQHSIQNDHYLVYAIIISILHDPMWIFVKYNALYILIIKSRIFSSITEIIGN